MVKQELQKYHKIASQIAAVMSVLAIFAMPYGYYIILRWVVSIAALVTAYIAYKNHKSGWVIGAVIALILWNPVAPVYLTKDMWFPLNIASAVFFFIAPKSVSKE